MSLDLTGKQHEFVMTACDKQGRSYGTVKIRMKQIECLVWLQKEVRTFLIGDQYEEKS